VRNNNRRNWEINKKGESATRIIKKRGMRLTVGC